MPLTDKERAAVKRAFGVSQLFSGMQDDVLEGFHGKALHLSPGQKVALEGDDRNSIGLIADGVLGVWSLAPDGNGVLLNTLGAGDCFGIANLLTGGSLDTQLCAESRVLIFLIPGDEVEGAFLADSALALRYARICNQKLQFLLRRIALLTAQTARGKLISYLLLRSGADGAVQLPGTKTDLAAELSVSRAQLYRELNYLRDEGCLQMVRGGMKVLDREKLEGLLYPQETENN
ncbi:MAG: Crp/Fnr family transcriptional regulator [Clostridia bacterium]|nr:Crp/Fnr family transcriptional regulator [Clostridia bacterium]